MTLWQRFKALSWVRAAGTFLAAVLFGVAAARLTRRGDRARAENQASAKMAASGAVHAERRANEHRLKAEKHHAKALAARAAAEKRLDQLGESDASLASLVSTWNFQRVRK